MCEFCERIYTEEETEENLEGKRKDSKGHILEEWIEIDEDGFNLVADTGDPYCTGYIIGVKYCPYCGRRLNLK